MTDTRNRTVAHLAWDALGAAGGIVTVAEIARRMEVTRAYASKITHRDDFPEPVDTLGNRSVWLWADVIAWRDADRPVGRPPRPTPAD